MTSLGLVLSDNAGALLKLVPATRDGAADAIHDARVATRRLRAALDLIERDRSTPSIQEAAAIARRIARALGRARDLDVSLELLADLERRVPAAAPGAALCRAQLLRERTEARRRLVRKIDGLPLETLPALVAAKLPRLDEELEARARERAVAVVDAVHHASGVYFPRRAHAARVGIKKLRYLLEFSASPDEEALKSLRKTQQILGEVQDRQVLTELVKEIRRGSATPAESLEPLLAQLEAECSELYQRFLDRRAELLAVCTRISAAPAARPARAVTGTLLLLGAVAAGSAWHGRRRHGH